MILLLYWIFSLYNYGDDTAVTFTKTDFKQESCSLSEWLKFNRMRQFLISFQPLLLIRIQVYDFFSIFNIADENISCVDITLKHWHKFYFKFNEQVTKMCKKARMQLDVLRLVKCRKYSSYLQSFKSFNLLLLEFRFAFFAVKHILKNCNKSL